MSNAELQAEVAKWKALAIHSSDEGTHFYYKDECEGAWARIKELEADASQLYALKTGLLDRVKCLEARNAELLKERATLNVDVAMAESVTKAAAEQGELYRKHMENYRAKANAQAGEITRLNERVAELTQVMAIANQQTDEITELRAKITELREAYE